MLAILLVQIRRRGYSKCQDSISIWKVLWSELCPSKLMCENPQTQELDCMRTWHL